MASTVPVLAQGVYDAVQLAVGLGTCARRRGGGVLCWGDNYNGGVSPDRSHVELPFVLEKRSFCRVNEPPEVDPENIRPWPSPVAGVEDAVDISMGVYTCAVRRGGAVTCWGDNGFGATGDDVTRADFQRWNVPGLPKAEGIMSFIFDSCIRSQTGEVWCWGSNGPLPPGTLKGPQPRRVPGVSGAVGFGQWDRTCAILTDDSVVCWGPSVGVDIPEDPAPAPEIGRVRGLVEGCALRPSGEVDCHEPYTGQSAKRVPLPPAAAITRAGSSVCALLRDGRVMCWGNNLFGQLGRPPFNEDDPIPKAVAW